MAKGLALALKDASMRVQLRDALRDSPFRTHVLPLASVLRAGDGALERKTAAALGISVEALRAMVESAQGLELLMPRALDRVSWDGTAELDVASTSATFAQVRKEKRASLRRYDAQGTESALDLLRYTPTPYLMLRRAEQEYPSELLVGMPRQTRSTISTADEERVELLQRGRENVAREAAGASGMRAPDQPRMMVPCDEECTGGGGSGGGVPPVTVGGTGATLPSYMTRSYCYGISPALNSTTDRDNDRISDDCENAMASALAPLLNIGNADRAPYRQPYFSASRHPQRDGSVQIFYAIAYLDDAGDASFGFESHIGDSEFIILEVLNTAGSKWGVVYATLSAHFGSGYDDTSTYYWDDLQYPSGGHPRIWSSLDKHGNYRNNAACDGSWLAVCGGDYWGTNIPASAANNLGNYFNLPETSRTTATWLHNCTNYLSSYPYRPAQECFWSDDDWFAGWNVNHADATPYRTLFSIFKL